MSSVTLYPPIVDSSMPAFKANTGECKIFFRLSKFNSIVTDQGRCTAHVSIVKQDTGMNVVKKRDADDGGHLRATGIIINVTIQKDLDTNDDDLYYVTITDDDLSSVVDNKEGWIPNWIYKIQLRLSAVSCDTPSAQAAWLNSHASDFSEWSTICIVKPIKEIYFDIDALNVKKSKSDQLVTLYSSTLVVSGRFYDDESTKLIKSDELIHSYRFKLFNDLNQKPIEDTGELLANSQQDNGSFNYTMLTELENNGTYYLTVEFETINRYTESNTFNFTSSQYLIDKINCIIISAENDPDNVLKDITSIGQEEEEGRIGLKLYDTDVQKTYSGNICIRRSDARSNFKVWTDIKIFVVKDEYINDLDMFYDYTIESGMWYKYGVQAIDDRGNRGVLVQTPALMRNFEYSFLLGENNQQLKLMFDNTMNNFKYQVLESKIDPIGSAYPIVTRNGVVRYRTFPITGLISFWADENKLFCNKKVIYKYDDVINLYEKYNIDNNIVQYDYIYEKDFRQKVLDFLYDGKIKLFKSPTEGNILVRLMDVSCVPNQSLDRMLYSFSCNAHEILESTMANYLKNGLYEVGEPGSDFSTKEIKIGQIQTKIGTTQQDENNLFNQIYEKYDSGKHNLGGYKKTLGNIFNLKIVFDDPPLRVKVKNDLVFGYKFVLNNKTFFVNGNTREYVFDERMILSPSDTLYFLGDEEGRVKEIQVTVDFLYEISSEVYEEKRIKTRNMITNVGQLFNSYKPYTNLYNEVYYKYYVELENTNQYWRLIQIDSIEIEADPGAVFEIKDASDTKGELHDIGSTGILNLADIENITSIIYMGRRAEDGSIDNTVNADILMNYQYVSMSGEYEEA